MRTILGYETTEHSTGLDKPFAEWRKAPFQIGGEERTFQHFAEQRNYSRPVLSYHLFLSGSLFQETTENAASVSL